MKQIQIDLSQDDIFTLDQFREEQRSYWKALENPRVIFVSQIQFNTIATWTEAKKEFDNNRRLRIALPSAWGNVFFYEKGIKDAKPDERPVY